jgi:hypothetical protein
MEENHSNVGSALTEQLASLRTLSLRELKTHWRELYRTQPPPRISKNLLTRAIAYRLQEQALGGLSSATRRLLGSIAASTPSTPIQHRNVLDQAPVGAVLIREWRGVTHRVTVLEDGVVYAGKRYRSLSEVARLITGSRWSGPLFFGLRTRAPQGGGDGTR